MYIFNKEYLYQKAYKLFYECEKITGLEVSAQNCGLKL